MRRLEQPRLPQRDQEPRRRRRSSNAFDSPPRNSPDPNDPEDLWGAHVRAIADRNRKIYRIAEVTAWTGDARKTYLANVGPLVCGFTVYEDFDDYDGGVYEHATGGIRGGHAVLVIGYDDDAGAWICRNSWGTGFAGAADADGTGAGYFMLGYGEANIDIEAFYGCQGVICPASTRWGGWWRVQSGVAAPGTSVTAVSRRPDHFDIFAVGTDHRIYTAACDPDGPTRHRPWPGGGGHRPPRPRRAAHRLSLDPRPPRPGVTRIDNAPGKPDPQLGDAATSALRRAAPAGRHHITARLARPWEKDAPIKTVEIDLIVE